ncbi:putative glucan 1,3-beta-glucosidase [Helianthus annuus]|nr:putative glucan 1,3-beta-glucosidase [Helianthus annuus]
MLLLLVLLFVEIQDGVDVTRVTVRIPNLFKIRPTLFYGCKVKFLKDHVSVSHTLLEGMDKVAACAKHFVADGGTTRGIDENNTVANQHELLSIQGVSTVMVSYSSWNG